MAHSQTKARHDNSHTGNQSLQPTFDDNASSINTNHLRVIFYNTGLTNTELMMQMPPICACLILVTNCIPTSSNGTKTPTTKATRSTGAQAAKSIGYPSTTTTTHIIPVKIAPAGIGRLAIAAGMMYVPQEEARLPPPKNSLNGRSCSQCMRNSCV